MLPSVKVIILLSLVSGLTLGGVVLADGWSAELADGVTPFEPAVIRTAVQALRESIDIYSASEPVACLLAEDGHVRFVSAPQETPFETPSLSAATLPDRAIAFLEQHAAAFGIYDGQVSLSVSDVIETGSATYVHLEQYWRDLPVFGGAACVIFNPQGQVTAVSSDLMRNIGGFCEAPESLTPTIAAEDAEDAARNARGAYLSARTPSDLQNSLLTAEPARLMIYDPAIFHRSGAPRLVYAAGIASTPVNALSEEVLVDARSGEVVFSHSRLDHARYRNIHDAGLQASLAHPPSTLVRYEGSNPAGDNEIDLNYEGFGLAYNYFYTNHAWDSFDDNGSAIESYVYWNSSDDAFWDSGQEVFCFGTGTSVQRYAQCDDIVGHEYAHAVISFRRALLSAGETGAIKEALADFWGEMIDWSGGTNPDYSADRWKIGEDLTSTGPLRSMASPETYGQPSFRGSMLFYYGPDQEAAAAVNSGVINKLTTLLVDGGTFFDHTVAPLGEANVRALYWQCLAGLLPAADFETFYAHLHLAAATLWPGDCNKRLAIQNAGNAVGIVVDNTFYCGPKSNPTPYVTEAKNRIHAGTQHGYDLPKWIYYKVYVPDNGYDHDATDERPAPQWPLDVIILSHGVGQNRNFAQGAANSIDGLARYWAKQGYVVVCPTYTKRRTILGIQFWEMPLEIDWLPKAISDLVQASYLRPGPFFKDRVRDLKFVREHLTEIFADNNLSSCFNAQQSKVVLAGHSVGAYTTLLAAGAVLRVGPNATPIDLDSQGLVRQYPGAADPPGGPVDDYGPFVPADAYIAISACHGVTEDEVVCFDHTRTQMGGRDYIQAPFMELTSQGDPGVDPGARFNAITKAVGTNDYPAYGVVITGANHITPVSQFGAWPSWSLLPAISVAIGEQEGTIDERTMLAQVLTEVTEWFNDRMAGQPVPKTDEEARLLRFREYTRDLLDAYVRPAYDTLSTDDNGLSGLQKSSQYHRSQDSYVYDFAHAVPPPLSSVQAMVVRDTLGQPLVQFQSDGNVLVLKGAFNSSSGTLTPSSSARELIFKHGSSVVGIVDSTSGNFRIVGTKVEQVSGLTRSASPEFVVRNGVDTGSTAQIILDQSGNLKLTGKVYQK